MPTNVFHLKILYEAQDKGVAAVGNQVKDTLNEVGRAGKTSGEGIRQTFRDVAGAFTSLLVAQNAVRTVFGFLAPATELQDTMAELRGTLKGTGADFEQLEQAAISAAAKTRFSPVEAMEGLRQLTAEGIRSQETLKGAITPMLQFAQAADVDMKTAAKLTAVQMREFGTEVTGVARAMEQAFALTKIFGVEAKELPRLVGRSAESFAIGAKDATDFLIAVGRIAGSARSSAVATTRMSATFAKLANPDVRRQLEENFGIFLEEKAHNGGIALLKDVILPIAERIRNGDLDPTTTASRIGDILDTARGFRGVELLVNTFAKGFKTLNGETKTGTALYDDLRQSLESSTLVQDIAIEKLFTLRGALERLRDMWAGYLAVVGASAVSLFTTVAGKIGSVAEALVGLVQSAGPVGTAIRNFISPLVTFTAVAVPVLAAAVSMAAGAKLLGVAWMFVRKELPLAFMGLKSIGVAAWGAMKGVRGLTFSVAGLKASLGSVVFLGLLAWDVIATIYDLMKDTTELGADEASKRAEESASVAARLVGAGDDMAESVEDAAQSLMDFQKPLSDLVDRMTGALKTKFPEIDFRPIDRAEAILKALATSPATAAPAQTALANLAFVREALRTDKAAPIEATGQITQAMLDVTTGLEALGIGGGKKGLREALADVGVEYGRVLTQEVKDRKASRDRALDPTPDRLTLTRAGGETTTFQATPAGIQKAEYDLVTKAESAAAAQHLERQRMNRLAAPAPSIRSAVTVNIDSIQVAARVIDHVRKDKTRKDARRLLSDWIGQ